jgi:putative ABC transport system ATP-binding protein
MVSTALIQLTDIQRRYSMGDEVVYALHGITLAIHAGEFLAIVGASGSGKTTIMNIIGCLDTPTSGVYSFEDKPVQELSDDELARLRNRRIGFVFQNFHLLPRMTALKNVELPLVYQGLPPRTRRERAAQALVDVGLGQRMTHRPFQMSGGQRQRVAIARALVVKPALLLADEPTGNLDSVTAKEIMRLFHELHAAGNTLVVVTHEPSVAAQCPRAVRLADGRVVDDGPGELVAKLRATVSASAGPSSKARVAG